MEELLDIIPEVFRQWGVELQRYRPDLQIAGSPQRSSRREVLEDIPGNCYVLEMLPPKRREKRLWLAATLQELSAAVADSRIIPWLNPRQGFGGYTDDAGRLWQLRRWVPGLELDREHYTDDAWRGECAAKFLAAINKYPGNTDAPFRLNEYIREVLPHFRQRIPALMTDLEPLLQRLQPYLEQEESLPVAFAHGDFHPGNILWGENQINGVIDWEFAGVKSAGYDAANLLGCIGADNPAALTGPMACTFTHQLLQNGTLDEKIIAALPMQTAALRLAWMREWVAQRNIPMLCQELDLIGILIDNAPLLTQRWLQ